MGCVNGGILSALLDTVMSAAAQTLLQNGPGYLTNEHYGEVCATGTAPCLVSDLPAKK